MNKFFCSARKNISSKLLVNGVTEIPLDDKFQLSYVDDPIIYDLRLIPCYNPDSTGNGVGTSTNESMVSVHLSVGRLSCRLFLIRENLRDCSVSVSDVILFYFLLFYDIFLSPILIRRFVLGKAFSRCSSCRRLHDRYYWSRRRFNIHQVRPKFNQHRAIKLQIIS